MPRQPRIEYEGAVYHVMSRGDGGGVIYRDARDKELFLETLGGACERTGWRVHAYALLSNHYHLLLETPEANLVAGMQWLQGTFTQRFNVRHGLRGHVLQGRYKAVVMESDEPEYFRRVGSYIHLNPVRAGLVRACEQPLHSYPWSSLTWYVKAKRHRPEWLEAGRVLDTLGFKDTWHGRKGYERYLEQRASEWSDEKGRKALNAEWKEIRRGWCLGGEEFRAELQDRLDEVLAGRRRESYSGEAVAQHDEWEAERLVAQGLDVLRLNEADLAELPKGDTQKCLLAWLVRKHTVVSNRWISDRLRMGHESNLSSRVRHAEESSADRELIRLRKELQCLLPK